jgi:hypothetical protein
VDNLAKIDIGRDSLGEFDILYEPEFEPPWAAFECLECVMTE